jgi:hypothetical protein
LTPVTRLAFILLFVRAEVERCVQNAADLQHDAASSKGGHSIYEKPGRSNAAHVADGAGNELAFIGSMIPEAARHDGAACDRSAFGRL